MLCNSLFVKLLVLLFLPSLLEANIGGPVPIWMVDQVIKAANTEASTISVTYGVGRKFDDDTPAAVCQRMEYKRAFTPCAFPKVELLNEGYFLDERFRHHRVKTKFTEGMLTYAKDPDYVFCQKKGAPLKVKPLSKRLEDTLQKAYNTLLLLSPQLEDFKRKAAYNEAFDPLLEDINSKAMEMNEFLKKAIEYLPYLYWKEYRSWGRDTLERVKSAIEALVGSIIAFQSNPEVIANGQAYGLRKIRINLVNTPAQISYVFTSTKDLTYASYFEIDLLRLYNVASECISLGDNEEFNTIHTIACTPL